MNREQEEVNIALAISASLAIDENYNGGKSRFSQITNKVQTKSPPPAFRYKSPILPSAPLVIIEDENGNKSYHNTPVVHQRHEKGKPPFLPTMVQTGEHSPVTIRQSGHYALRKRKTNCCRLISLVTLNFGLVLAAAILLTVSLSLITSLSISDNSTHGMYLLC